MRVYLGCDHAGFALKEHLRGWLAEHSHEPVDCGAVRYDPADYYPASVSPAGQRTAADPDGRGVVSGGSGNGEAIAANKVTGVRAALVWSEQIARLAREHNDANVISLGARMHSIEQATRFVEIFLHTAFSGDPRHLRRIAMIGDYERDRATPAGR